MTDLDKALAQALAAGDAAGAAAIRQRIAYYENGGEPELRPIRNWGGKREGAGRPALYQEPMVEYTVTLPPDMADALRELGGGNLSAGVRKLASALLWEM
ncbi:MAG: hypothetical protein WC683_12695 [bacterium]